MELHPRLDPSNLILSEKRIILGSFPVWSLTKTNPHNNEEEKLKTAEKLKNGDFDFFYGSSSNLFWHWHREFIDRGTDPKDIASIKSSLQRNKIGITDIILSCERQGKSALDKHLTKREYNHQFFIHPKEKETLKILCTSKGLMNEMLLNKRFFQLHSNLQIDEEFSKLTQSKITIELSGYENRSIKPFFVRLKVKNGGLIECYALPSPGSPYRRLIDFGLNTEANTFLKSYLKLAFRWFTS